MDEPFPAPCLGLGPAHYITKAQWLAWCRKPWTTLRAHRTPLWFWAV